MRPIDKILATAGARPRRSLYVSEWDLEIYWSPVTLHDQRQLGQQKLCDELDLAVHLVVRKAEDADGERLFSLADAHTLATEIPAAPIATLAAAMVEDLAREVGPADPAGRPEKE